MEKYQKKLDLPEEMINSGYALFRADRQKKHAGPRFSVLEIRTIEEMEEEEERGHMLDFLVEEYIAEAEGV